MSCLVDNWRYFVYFDNITLKGRSFSQSGDGFFLFFFLASIHETCQSLLGCRWREQQKQRRLYQMKANRSDASLIWVLLRLPSAEILRACVERPCLPWGWGSGDQFFFWTNTNSFWVRCFDAINPHKMCFRLEFTNLLKNSLAWILGVSQSDLATYHACAAPGGILTKTHANADTCLKIQLSRSPHLAWIHVSAADWFRELISAFDLWPLGGKHPLGWGLFL